MSSAEPASSSIVSVLTQDAVDVTKLVVDVAIKKDITEDVNKLATDVVHTVEVVAPTCCGCLGGSKKK
jgi:hypothetical protein